MKDIAFVAGLVLVLGIGVVVGTSCSNGGGDTPPTTMAAALTTTTTTTTTTCPANPATYTVDLVLTAPKAISSPPYQRVCPNDTVIWNVKNDCANCSDLRVTIHDRHHRHETQCGAGNTIDVPKDCFKKSGGNDCKPENGSDPAQYGQTKKIGECSIKAKADVTNGCYKYDLKVKVKVNGNNDNFDVDPEVEVQGGNQLDTQGPQTGGSPTTQQSPSPRVSPSP